MKNLKKKVMISHVKKFFLFCNLLVIPTVFVLLSSSCWKGLLKEPNKSSENIENTPPSSPPSSVTPEPKTPTAKVQNQYLTEEMPIPDFYVYETLEKNWEWAKELENIVNKNNPTLSKEERISKIVEIYKKALDKIGYEISDKKTNTIFEKIDSDLDKISKNGLEKDTKYAFQLISNKNRLFDDGYLSTILDENDKSWWLSIYADGALYWKTSPIIFSIIRNYIKLKIIFYEEIRGSYRDDILEKLKNNKNLENIFQQLNQSVSAYIDPINHYSYNEQYVFSNFSPFYKKLYIELINWYNKEIAPLQIKLGLKTNNPLTKWQYDEHVTKYFYPLINTTIKTNYTTSEIDAFYEEWERKNSIKYSWRIY
ncbi:hypothetical protein [Mesomycoplasma neurolyticum]|uniref:Lipoprotein n=1 Tax=Mesomycoplasma neurolyticum TaxID=2120 RepID=A0A449A6L4_9BACT|nr:hypothetical protein [Mesomycoplasma neurolyticum]VEU59479.1 Uncharacterised protein [Mesomycoplasma neurolyticum]VEU59884.1 Uncharacterised protein [Mesomycoplasma neurolyticum]